MLSQSKNIITSPSGSSDVDVITDSLGTKRLAIDAIVAGYSTTSLPSISRDDFNGTVTATGDTGAILTAGFGTLSVQINVTAVSGAGARADFELQSSEDATNWTVLHDSKRITAVDIQRFPGVRVAGKYYRIVWTIGGTTPSFTFVITTTLKGYSAIRNVSLNRYADIDLATLNAKSTQFSPQTCANVSFMIVRSNVVGGTVAIQIEASNDGANFAPITTAQTFGSLTTLVLNFTGQGFRFYRASVANPAVAGTTGDIFWAANGGS